MLIDNRHDFHDFATFREPHGLTAVFGRRKRRINETLAFINSSFVAQCIHQLCEHVPQDLTLTPLLKAPMNGIVVGIALRQELPLCPGVQNPEHRLKDGPGWDRFASRPTVRNVLKSAPIGHRADEACPDL